MAALTRGQNMAMGKLGCIFRIQEDVLKYK